MFFSVESLSAVNEENNKRNNTTGETPTTLNIADIPIIDSDTSLSDQQIKEKTDETSDEDEEVYLKRFQSTQARIDPSNTNERNDEDEDEDDEPDGNDVRCQKNRFDFD